MTLLSVIGAAKNPEPVEVSTGCIYGTIGTGKTHLICSASKYFEPRKVLIATLDQSDETLSKFSDLNVIDLLSLVDPNKEGRSIADVMKRLIKDVRGLQAGRFDFFAYDCLSKLVQLRLIELRQDIASRNDHPSIWDDVTSQQMYGIAQNQMVEWFWELKRICVSKRIHFWVIAWEAKPDWRVTDDVPTGFNYFSPQMPPSLAAIIRQDWGFQGRMELTNERGKTVPQIIFSSPFCEAKTRADFPNKVINPTVGKLLDGRYGLKKGIESEKESVTVEEPSTP